MKTITLSLLLLTSFAYSQTNIFPTSGNVGIGTTAPSNRLEIFGSTFNRVSAIVNANVQSGFQIKRTGIYATDWEMYSPASSTDLRFFNGGDRLTLMANGNVGIGTTTPTSSLHLFNSSGYTYLNIDKSSTTTEGGIRFSRTGTPLFYLFNDDSGDALKIQAHGLSGEDDGKPRMMFPLTDTNILMALSGGNVGIGTSSPDARLAVKGKVHAEEVKVSLTVPAPDYVFEKEYNLPSLSEIAIYIKQNKHLPEVPSAKEMEANGINLSEMNMILLKKVEELTLHLIELKKENVDQQQEINALKRAKK